MPFTTIVGAPPVVDGTRSASVVVSASGAVAMNACHAATTSAAAAHGHRSTNVVTVPTLRVANVRRVTMP